MRAEGKVLKGDGSVQKLTVTVVEERVFESEFFGKGRVTTLKFDPPITLVSGDQLSMTYVYGGPG